MGLPINQKALLIWDAFRSQQSQPTTDTLEDYNLVTVMVPKNLTHLLQPHDLTTNGSFKKMERAALRDYFTNTITKELESDPEKDETTIKVDLKLSNLKPIHAKLMNKIYQHFKQVGRQTILNGWKSAEVVRAVEGARSGAVAEFNLLHNEKRTFQKACFFILLPQSTLISCTCNVFFCKTALILCFQNANFSQTAFIL